MSAETKKCTKCGEVKPLDAFRLQRGGRLRGACIDCEKTLAASRRKMNIEAERNRHKEWRNKHPGYAALKSSLYRKSNAKQVRMYANAWWKSEAEKLSPLYLSRLLGALKTNIPAEIIELKRQQLQLHRLAREFKRTVKEVFK